MSVLHVHETIYLKNVEVDRVVVRLGADDPSPAGVPHHHVGVRARRDDTLPEMIRNLIIIIITQE